MAAFSVFALSAGKLQRFLVSQRIFPRMSTVNQQQLLLNRHRRSLLGSEQIFYVSTGSIQPKDISYYKYHLKKYPSLFMYATLGVILVGATMLIRFHRLQAKASQPEPVLPVYTSKDISQHNSMETGIWVSYGSGVYDITQFVSSHPGGDQILLAAGGSLEPFWILYSFHQTVEILKMLEEYHIGLLSKEDQDDITLNTNDPYENDPKRHPVLRANSIKPFNAEPPIQLLVQNSITPNDIFYVRNHLPVPHIDANNYELEICVPGHETVTMSLEELKSKFTKHTIVATIQCAGNRRSELTTVKPVKGLNWGVAAISTASWSGARLRDVLQFAGLSDDDVKIKHIQFEGLDLDTTGVAYGASILRNKAMDRFGDVLVAYEMNGSTIPRDHGYPVRLVAPGIVGARSVKWLARIVASEDESNSHWQQNDYKGFSPSVDWDTVDFKSAPAIQDLPVQSAICNPVNGSVVQLINGSIEIKGYAWSGGGRQVVRVDVSSDDGKSWHTANLEADSSPPSQAWAWRLWKVNLPVQVESKEKKVALICKAVDSSYNVQPDTVEPIWNLRGVLNNAWHRVTVTVKDPCI